MCMRMREMSCPSGMSPRQSKSSEERAVSTGGGDVKAAQSLDVGEKIALEDVLALLIPLGGLVRSILLCREIDCIDGLR